MVLYNTYCTIPGGQSNLEKLIGAVSVFGEQPLFTMFYYMKLKV